MILLFWTLHQYRMGFVCVCMQTFYEGYDAFAITEQGRMASGL